MCYFQWSFAIVSSVVSLLHSTLFLLHGKTINRCYYSQCVSARITERLCRSSPSVQVITSGHRQRYKLVLVSFNQISCHPQESYRWVVQMTSGAFLSWADFPSSFGRGAEAHGHLNLEAIEESCITEAALTHCFFTLLSSSYFLLYFQPIFVMDFCY